jgi:glycosyltransferase involved in cell wall biosynthesis
MQLIKSLSVNPAGPLRATAVVVLYGMAPGQSPAFRSLMEARTRLQPELGRVFLVLWDNSASPHVGDTLPEDVIYLHDPRNPGLAAAYNGALEIAIQHGSNWLITLDQDSTVPADYMVRMANAARLCSGFAGVAAIVPQIAAGAKRLSPNYFLLGAMPRWFPRGFRGTPRQPVFAFNSGTMVSVSVLEQIGGYDTRFPLDHSDAALFRRLHQFGKRVYVEGGIQLEHEFSMADMNRRMNVDRYRGALLAETAFWDLHMNRLAGCERTARLALRMFRHWQRGHRAELRKITREFLFYRLFHSREARLRRWREWLGQKGLPASGPGKEPKARPRVSVCMAAFNGARFIEAQIESILPQLAAGDEIVIVDDGSEDETVARVARIGDARIRLFAHERNQGAVATFEDALRCATGDILFLCDDDDLWHPEKVEKVLREFAQHPEVNVVTSRVALIDDRGARLPDARVNRYGRFFPGFWRNVVKNHYQGSAMAIRASFLGLVLPFPQTKSFLHDAWIGTRNEALGGTTAFINEPLLYYRRHAQNLSRRHSWLNRVRLRIDLLLAHILRAIGASNARSLRHG